MSILKTLVSKTQDSSKEILEWKKSALESLVTKINIVREKAKLPLLNLKSDKPDTSLDAVAYVIEMNYEQQPDLSKELLKALEERWEKMDAKPVDLHWNMAQTVHELVTWHLLELAKSEPERATAILTSMNSLYQLHQTCYKQGSIVPFGGVPRTLLPSWYLERNR